MTGKTADYLLQTWQPSPRCSCRVPPVKNEALLTNRLGLNMKFKPMEDVQVKTRLLMYKVLDMKPAVR